nr:immunoglobulin light chain junction region [Macaca mulatta]MOX08839.1 immunoglobulin light chain junction region [Macaca mulatta]MOX09057.1 immunoglobulin light chain junction region [Macaca mulatta]
CMQGTQDVTF